MAKKVTAANTGLYITRSGNKFTAGWTIATKSPKVQQIRYCTHNWTGWLPWVTVTIDKSATSYSFELSNNTLVAGIWVETSILRDNTSKNTYSASAWESSSALFITTAPPAPTLTVSSNSANSTTFSWVSNANDTDTGWFTSCWYRTKCTATPDSAADWSDWAQATESSYTYNDTTFGTTRIFQIKAVGPAGESAIQAEAHVISSAPAATWKGKPTYSTRASYYELTYNVGINGSIYTVDSIVPQYFIGTPTATMDCPSGASFNDGTTYSYSNGNSNYTLALTTSDLVDYDECLWARVKTVHDSVESRSEPYRVITGALTAPTATVSLSSITASGFTCNISNFSAGTSVPGVFANVYLEKASRAGIENYIKIGTVPNGQTSATITSTINLTEESGYSIHIQNVTQDGYSMKSDYYTHSSSMPQAPVLDKVSPTTVAGKIFVEWTNRWAEATGVVIAWTDDPDNWMSNDAPETFEVDDLASQWYLTGLETGKTWWVRVRSVRIEDDTETKSPWSADVPIDLSSAPAVPVLYLSDETITENDVVTAYWSYATTDGTPQVAGNVVIATYSNGAWSYGRTVGATVDAQHIDINAKQQGWTNGTVVYLALQTRSGSGGVSGYSTPVKLVIAAKPTVSISSTSLASSDTVTEYFEGDGTNTVFLCANTLSGSPTVKVNGSTRSATYSGDKVTVSTAPADGATVAITYPTASNKVLKAMPFTATIAATNATNVTLAIERAETYPMLRPDGTETDGPKGETVYVLTRPADATNTFTITVDDLIGRLDDGAFYNLVATVTDRYKQTAKVSQRFKVHWTHQAWEPSATFVTDETELITKITPVSGSGYVSGDTCDIYRLGIDKPELIYSGAAFGTQYVDPFPAFGANSGYKVVTVTANNDYITEEQTFAELDTTESDDYVQLDPKLLVIDFDGDRVELPYNISLDNSWSKDFERTTYLGGHVTGDHNKAVTRDLSAKTVTARRLDTETTELMRKLARYAGICHVRTPEGSSFAADVQVSESMSADSGLASYSLSIQKVDNNGFDAMTITEWNEMQ